jgi:hypothetical protein
LVERATKSVIGMRNVRATGSPVMAGKLEREILWRASLRPQAEAPKSWRANFAASWKRIFAVFGLVSLTDQVLVSGGLTAALASAGFAVFMMSTDHSNPTFPGIEHLMLFAQPIHGKPPALMARVRKTPPGEPGIDDTVTGSIRPKVPLIIDKGELPQVRLPATEPIIKAYVLQEARNGAAIIQGRTAAYRVLPGAFLPGAGRVISIEQRDDRWVVVTTQGIIVDRLSVQEAP